MLNKLRVNFKLSKKLLVKFKSLFVLSFFACFISSFNIIDNLSFENSLLLYTASILYQNMLLAIMFISTMFTISTFDKSFNVILRYKNKKEYLESLVIMVLIVNLIVYLAYSFFGVIFMLIKCFNNIRLEYLPYYNIPFIIYNIYTYIKYFIIIEIFINIIICFYKLLGKTCTALLFVSFIAVKEMYTYKIEIISSLKGGHLFYGYFLNPFEYSSITFDIISLLIEIIIIITIYKFFKYLVCKHKKISINEKIGE